MFIIFVFIPISFWCIKFIMFCFINENYLVLIQFLDVLNVSGLVLLMQNF